MGGTKEYQDLHLRVSKSLRELTDLKDVPGFTEVVITKFKSTSNNFGEFVAEMVVVIDKEAHEANTDDSMTAQQALKNAANKGSIGNLKVDPASLSLKEPVSSEPKDQAAEEDENIGFFTGTKLYIVIACIAALTLVAIVQIGCTIYKMANKPSSGSKDQQVEHGLDQESRMYNK